MTPVRLWEGVRALVAFLLLVPLLAGCMQPSGPESSPWPDDGSPPASGAPWSSTSASVEPTVHPTKPPRQPDLGPTCKALLPHRTGDGVHVELAASPTTARPGDPITLCAAVFNDGPTVFTFQSCAREWYGVDDHGQTWGRDGLGTFVSELVCDGDNGTASLAAGEAERWNHQEIVPRGLSPPLTLFYNVTFRGHAAGILLHITAGEGAGRPTVELTSNRTSLRSGEKVTFHATVHNPTERVFGYTTGCGADTVPMRVKDDEGRVLAQTLARQGTCPIGQTNLPPGGTVSGELEWDGRSADGLPYSGTVHVRASFSYDAHGAADSQGPVGAETQFEVEWPRGVSRGTTPPAAPA